MNGLLIDCSASAFIAQVEGKKITFIYHLEGGKNLTKALFPKLQELGPFKNFDYIAVGIGPGSYMGLRTAATIAQTLAYALNLPLISFPSSLSLEEAISFVATKAQGGANEAQTLQLQYSEIKVEKYDDHP